MRIVHLGLGVFHRAHQAWYTAQVDPSGQWGIAAFTGRGPEAARTLTAQGCRYTLLVRTAEGDRAEMVDSIVQAYDASQTSVLRELLSRPAVSVVTLTVTEKGYRLGVDALLDVDDEDVRADVAALRSAAHTALSDGVLRTVPGRLVWALQGRRAAGAGPIAVVPCDNVPRNGDAVRSAVTGLAALVDPDLGAWIDASVDWISTSVDRITPRVTPADLRIAEELTGFADRAPVVTEPFRSWILAGDFRGPRPRWEDAGAQFVDEIEPFERRKLWLLNGAHSLLAYTGLPRGHETVAQAVADDRCRRAMRELWDLSERHLALADETLRLGEYRTALEERFRNPAIAHLLRQIAADGSVKLRHRIVEPVRRERAAGRDADAGLRVLAAWIDFVRAEVEAGRSLDDVAEAELVVAAASGDPVRALLAVVSAELAADRAVIDRLTTAAW